MRRTLALTKMVDLSKVADNWTGAYVKFSPMLVKEMAELSKSNDGTDSQDIDKLTVQMLTTLKAKFLEGKVVIETADGTELDDMTADDIESLPFDTLSTAFATLIGTDFDPKAISRAQESVTLPTKGEPTTATQS